MRWAALAAGLLDASLQSPAPLFGRNFQRRLAKVLADPWQMATGQDRLWPVAAEAYQPKLPERIMQWYMNRLLAAMVDNGKVAEAFVNVQNMTASPLSMMHPSLMWQVLRHTRQHGRDNAENKPSAAEKGVAALSRPHSG